MSKEKSCGAVVYKKDNNDFLFLIIKSKTHNFYSFPKGHVEGNETEEETALREVFEETNLQVKLHPTFKEVIAYSPSKSIQKTVVYFLGEANNLNVRLQIIEISDYKWLKYEEAYQLTTYENEKQVLKSAYEFLLNNMKK